MLLKRFIDSQVSIYNGRKMVQINVKKQMIGFPISAFYICKRLGPSIHEKKKSKKGKKQKQKKRGNMANAKVARLQYHGG